MSIFDCFKNKELVLVPPCKGAYAAMENIPDKVFSDGILGPCCAVNPIEENICAPCDGELVQIADTLHAFCIVSRQAEILVHLGIDTVKLNGNGFTALAKAGDKVKAGQPIIKMDIEYIVSNGLSPLVITVVTNSDDLGKIEFAGTESCLLKININKD